MKKINLTKYGFIRSQEDDFTDDGGRFTCFKVGDVKVTKLVSDGIVYISARIIDDKLPYEIYFNLPHYRALDKLNGVSLSSLTEEDLIELFNACINFQQEYKDAVNQVKYPTLKELQDKCEELTNELQKQLDKAEQLIKDNILKVFDNSNKYRLQELMEYYRHLKSNVKNSYNKNTYPQAVLGTSMSFNLMKAEPTKSWYLTKIEELTNI